MKNRTFRDDSRQLADLLELLKTNGLSLVEDSG